MGKKRRPLPCLVKARSGMHCGRRAPSAVSRNTIALLMAEKERSMKHWRRSLSLRSLTTDRPEIGSAWPGLAVLRNATDSSSTDHCILALTACISLDASVDYNFALSLAASTSLHGYCELLDRRGLLPLFQNAKNCMHPSSSNCNRPQHHCDAIISKYPPFPDSRGAPFFLFNSR